MAEILGVVAGIVGIADAGFKLYLALSATASALGSAGSEILLFSSEVRIFAEILVVVRANLKDQTLKSSRSEILDKAIGVIPGLIAQCELIYASMERILNRLQPYKDSKFRMMSKLKWMQDKSKMLELRGFLEPLKSSLQLLLSLIKNEAADNNHEPIAIRTILREELKAAFEASKSQPDTLDKGSVDIEGEKGQVALIEHALVLRTKPMRTIKEAANHMIALHNTFHNLDDHSGDDPRQKTEAYDRVKGKKRARIPSPEPKEEDRSVLSSNDAMSKHNYMADEMSDVSRCATDGDSEASFRDHSMKDGEYDPSARADDDLKSQTNGDSEAQFRDHSVNDGDNGHWARADEYLKSQTEHYLRNSVQRDEDGSWRSNEVTGQRGLDPETRKAVADVIPTLKEEEDERKRLHKNIEVDEWRSRSMV